MWQTISANDELTTPALAVYPARIRENIRRMIALAGGVDRLRPHVKTHKMSPVVQLQLAAGITRFKCATPAEAEMVAGCQAPDVLLAYQPVGPNVGRLRQLVERFPATRFSTIVDDASATTALSKTFAAVNERLDILVDIDNGMGRTGIAPTMDRAGAIYEQVAASPGLRAAGLHVYDGHIREADRAERQAHCDADFAPVLRLRDELTRRGLQVEQVVAGGTPTFPIHAQHADRQCSPGTCILWDASYSGKFPDLDFLWAALVLSRVISKPRADRLCVDLGYKSISADNPDPRVVWIDLPDARAAGHSEEHLVVETAEAAKYSVGSLLYGIPYHVCPTVALHAEALVIDDGRVVDRWAVDARDRQLRE